MKEEKWWDIAKQATRHFTFDDIITVSGANLNNYLITTIMSPRDATFLEIIVIKIIQVQTYVSFLLSPQFSGACQKSRFCQKFINFIQLCRQHVQSSAIHVLQISFQDMYTPSEKGSASFHQRSPSKYRCKTGSCPNGIQRNVFSHHPPQENILAILEYVMNRKKLGEGIDLTIFV